MIEKDKRRAMAAMTGMSGRVKNSDLLQLVPIDPQLCCFRICHYRRLVCNFRTHKHGRLRLPRLPRRPRLRPPRRPYRPVIIIIVFFVTAVDRACEDAARIRGRGIANGRNQTQKG
jgi:hypothetical protein